MSTYVLSGHDRTTVALTGPVQVRVVEEGPPGVLGVQLRRSDGSEHPADRPAGGVLILRSVQGRVVVRVVPPAGTDKFPDGVQAGLRLRAAAGPSDEVLVRPVNVSRLGHRDLVALEPVTDGARPGLAVSALDAVEEVPIGPLQAEARDTMRIVVGADRVRDADARDVVVVVDPSASMAPALADGSVEAAVDVLAGLALVVARDRTVRVRLAGRDPGWLPRRELPGLGADVAARITAGGLECGFRPDVDLPPDGLGVIVSDGLPAAAAPGWHVLVLGPEPVAPRGVPVTTLPAPPPGRGAVERLLGDPGLLRRILGSLVADDRAVTR